MLDRSAGVRLASRARVAGGAGAWQPASGGRVGSRETARPAQRDIRARERPQERMRHARRKEMRIMTMLVRPGEVVWDVGAHHGLLSVLAARRTGPAGGVHSFEPSPRNRWFIEHHLRFARLNNVVVHPMAVGAFDGEVPRCAGLARRTFALWRGEVVQVRTGRTLVTSGALPRPEVVRIDAADTAADVLRGALAELSPATRMLIAVHSREAFESSCEVLGRYGYLVLESRELRDSLDGEEWKGAPPMVCFGPAHRSWRRDRTRLELLAF